MPRALKERGMLTDRSRTRSVAAVIGTACVVAVLFGLMSRLSSGSRMVSNLTVRNETAFDVTLDASGSSSGPATPLGVVGHQATENLGPLIDQGQVWYIHIASEGVDGGTIVESRADLARSGWAVVVGAGVESRLRSGGLTPGRSSTP